MGSPSMTGVDQIQQSVMRLVIISPTLLQTGGGLLMMNCLICDRLMNSVLMDSVLMNSVLMNSVLINS